MLEDIKSIISPKHKTSDLDWIYFILAKEFGLTQDKFKNVSIPYIMGLLKVTREYAKKKQKAAKGKR